MPYLETVQELLDDGTSLSTNLVRTYNQLAGNLRPDTQDQYSSCRRNTNMGRLTSEKYAASQH